MTKSIRSLTRDVIGTVRVSLREPTGERGSVTWDSIAVHLVRSAFHLFLPSYM